MISDLKTKLVQSAKPLRKRRSIWLFAFLSAVVGYVALLTHYEAQIADVETQIADIEGIVSSDTLFARARPHLIARRDGIVGHLRGVLVDDTAEADAIGQFLGDAHTIAKRNGVTVVSVAQDLSVTSAKPAAVRPPPLASEAIENTRPGAPQSTLVNRSAIAAARARAASAFAPRPFDGTFVAMPFHLSLVGGYTPLLRMIAQLPTGKMLVRIDRVAIDPGQIGTATLSADVRVSVYRPMPNAAALMRGFQ